MIYYAQRRLNAAGCAIVTASHHPATVNGLKWLLGDRPPTPDDVAALERGAEAQPVAIPAERTPGKARALDISFDYVACLQETFVDSMAAQQHVVVDPMYGCWAAKARRYLHAIFPQCLFSTIHDVPLGDFGGRTPDCSRPHELHELCDALYRERAHLGIAFDGDGDRIALVDGEGVPLRPEEAAWVLLQSYGPELQGQRFVYDVKFSDRIPEAARELGAEPMVERSGHAFIRARMRESGALFGAEVSGHYFHRSLDGGEDGLYTACRLIAWLSRTGRSLAEVRRECPPVCMSHDLRLPVAVEEQPRMIEQVRAAWAQFPQQTIDGVRIDTPCGWALVRSSVTEPALTFRFEGLDWHALEDLIDRFCKSLPELGDALRQQHRASMGTEGP